MLNTKETYNFSTFEFGLFLAKTRLLDFGLNAGCSCNKEVQGLASFNTAYLYISYKMVL